MDVYVNKVTAPYGGGLAIVASNSVEEAHGTLLSRYKDVKDKWLNDWYADIYKPETWKRLGGVRVDSDVPYVLEESHYVE